MIKLKGCREGKGALNNEIEKGEGYAVNNENERGRGDTVNT